MGKAAVKVGCCGFAAARARYFQAFALVEVQQTFYQPPRPDTVTRWRQEAPPGFEFTLKAWQLITHEARSPTYRRLKTPLSDDERQQAGGFRWSDVVRRAWDTTLAMARRLDAGKVVFQCPASFRPTDESKDNLRRFFARIDRGGLTCIWEPRGAWPPDEVASLCQELDLVHCVDPFQAECVTAGLHYYRLHGISGYRHRYTDEELQELSQRRAKGAATYCLFNNVSMFDDARRFQSLLKPRQGTRRRR